jgi:hypothetical protein
LQALCDSTHRSCGKHSLVYWGHSSNLAWSTNPDEAAAQVCLVHYEYSNGDIWTAQTTAVAARNGQLGALKFLHQHGCLWDVTTCTEAANWGHLACLQYAHVNGCKWNAETCTKAAQSGRLGTLKYVVDNGCEVNVQTLAAAMPHPLCIQLLRDKGFWKVDPLLTAAAACTRDLPLLRQLHEQAVPGISGLVRQRLEVVISRVCSTRTSKAVPGTAIPAVTRRTTEKWNACVMRSNTAARGLRNSS